MDRYKVFPSGEMGMHPAGNWTPYADAQATVEALQRERDEADKRAEQCRKDRAMALNVKTSDGLTASEWLMRTAVAEQKSKTLQAALDAEREKVKGLESEGVKLFEWRLALHSLTPGGSEFCTPDACEQWVRKNRTSQHEYIIEQIKQRKGLQTQLSQLQALVRALVGTKSFTINGPDIRTMGGSVLYACSSPTSAERLGALLEYRERTLAATTPAADTSIIGKCEPPSQWDPNAQVRGDIS